MHRAILLVLVIIAGALSGCDEVTVVHPRPHPMVIGGMPHHCVEIRDPALRARVMTRLEPRFRGPRRGGAHVTLRQHLRTHRYRVFDCGDVWRIMFIAQDMRMAPDYVILRKDGVVLYHPF